MGEVAMTQRPIDPEALSLAEQYLPRGGACDALAVALQQTCLDHAEEYAAWCAEQASLRGYSDDERARI